MKTLIALAAMVALMACTKKSPETAPETAPEATSKSTNDGGGVQALSAQGKRVYLAHCTSCHNSDPGKDGVMGPAVAGSSLELVRTRVLEGGYPPGYKPKRDTKVMAALPHLKGDIEALTAYLNAP